MKLETAQRISLGFQISLALVLAIGAVLAGRYNASHPSTPVHEYNSADLVRDTKYCEAAGLKIKLNLDHDYPHQTTTIVGAACQDKDGNEVAIAPMPGASQ